MKLFQRIFFAAVLAGLAAGLAMTVLQQWRIVPLIIAAESYEAPASAHEHADAAAASDGHTHDAEAWAPQDGAERTFYTVLADLLATTGFTLLLAAVSVLAGIEITARNGVIWGLGGFLAFQLAPAFGLPPELPGMAAAELGARQLWWWGTALATGAGLLAIARFHNPLAIAVGAVLLAAPHVIGAPQLVADHASAVPAHMATSFAATTLGIGAVFWLLAGPLLGWLNQRLARLPAFAIAGAHP